MLRQMVNFLSFGPDGILKGSLGAYRKGHNTTTVLLVTRDNILHSMKRCEVTSLFWLIYRRHLTQLPMKLC